MKRILQRLWNALTNSLNGIKSCFRTEVSFRQELLLGIVVATIALFLSLSLFETLLLLVTYGNILIAELFNSAIEKAVDYISLDKHPLAKIIKDTASAAVFVAILVFAIVCIGLVFKVS
jgi:diacylglycerol kinase (ATP)